MNEKTVNWLDSSAVLALLRGEPGAETVRRLLEAAERERTTVYISAVTLTEVVASVARVHGENVAREDLALILTMPVQIDSPTARQCGEAGWLRWRYKISTADAIIATQAITNDAELVHKDPEFEAIVGLRQQQLPYKTKSPRRS